MLNHTYGENLLFFSTSFAHGTNDADDCKISKRRPLRLRFVCLPPPKAFWTAHRIWACIICVMDEQRRNILFFVMEKNGVVLFEMNEYPYIEIYSYFLGSHVVLRSFFMSFFKIIFVYVWVFMGHFFGFMLNIFGLLVSSYIHFRRYFVQITFKKFSWIIIFRSWTTDVINRDDEFLHFYARASWPLLSETSWGNP